MLLDWLAYEWEWFYCVRRNRWIPVPVPKPPGHWTTTTLSSRWLGHFPLLTIEAGTQGTWCGADFLYNLYNGRSMKQPSHSKVLHPTPDIGHNPDCVARVLTHPGSTRWCKVTQKLRRRRHPPTIVTSSTSDCRWAQASDKIQRLWLSRSQTNIFVNKNSTSARYHSEKH